MIKTRNNQIRVCWIGLAILLGLSHICAQGLVVAYGSKGISSIAFNGLTLHDVTANPGDTFHIWHAQSTTISTGAVNGLWGEDTTSQTWDASSHTETYTYSWGSIATQFVQSGSALNTVVTITNNAGSGINYNGAEVDPFVLHFPSDPFGGYSQFIHPEQGPPVTVASYTGGIVASALTDSSKSVYTGFKQLGNMAYTPVMTSTPPDGYPAYWDAKNASIAPGTSFSYTVSLRFGNTSASVPLTDVYQSFATRYPSTLNWVDRRVMGDAFLASSPNNNGDKTQPGGFPTNPRRWFNDSNVDTTTAAGLASFQQRILGQAHTIVTNSSKYNVQGTITWDMEGEQYPQDTSYVCSPDMVETVAPEMGSILPSGSEYAGSKLIDAYFAIQTSAGYKAGACIRPQHFNLFGTNQAQQTFLTDSSSIIAELKRKIQYAHDRWGLRLFYVDSMVNTLGGALDPSIMQAVQMSLTDSLIIPEQTWPRNYAYNGAFKNFIFNGATGTDTSVYNVYPQAFSVVQVNDADPTALSNARATLVANMTRGDVMMIHTDNTQANNDTIRDMYIEAHPLGAVNPVFTPFRFSGTRSIRAKVQ